MASKILDLLIKVNDQASKELEKIQGTTTGKGSGVAGLGDALLATTGYAVMAGMALQKIGGYVEDSIDEFTDYVMGVDALSKAFDLTIEEGEKVILMAEAFNVSNDALFSTLNKLAREGFGTGAEALNGLREAFQAIEDPAERATFLFGVAGEQGQKVLAPMLEMTELEWASFEEGMEALTHLNEETVANANELNMATAELEKSWANLKISFMEFAAPGLTALIDTINNLLTGEPVITTSPTPGADRPTLFDNQYEDIWGNPNASVWNPRGGGDELTETLRNLPDSISDAIERSSTGLGH